MIPNDYRGRADTYLADLEREAKRVALRRAVTEAAKARKAREEVESEGLFTRTIRVMRAARSNIIGLRPAH